MSSRPPNAQEMKLWRIFERRIKAVKAYTTLITAKTAQIDIALIFGAQAGVPIPMISADLVDRQMLSEKATKKWSTLHAAIMAEQLGIQLRNNDLDIVASPTMTADQVAYFQTLGIAPLVWLVGGAICLLGGLAAIWKTMTENENLVDDFNALLLETDQRYCSVPNSDLCRAWLRRKNDQDYRSQETIVKKAKNEIAAIGSGIGSGISTGIGLLFPVLAFFLLSRWGDR
jgi:hypothetical protein